MQVDFVSIFPDLVRHWFSQGVVGRAANAKIVKFRYISPRSFSNDKHGRIDDRPFGGGPGMVMQYTPLHRTAQWINQRAKIRPFHIYMNPQGTIFTQDIAKQLAEKQHIVLWCGRYEGIDQRFIDTNIDMEISIGDFVISGGEIPSVIVADAISRLVPGVLGDENSAREDSFHQKLLDHPHYTRPEIADRMSAPAVLLSGNHARIARWRLKQALGKTFIYRPDIFQTLELSGEQISLLNEFLAEYTFSESCNESHH